jgi:hypothetical protein
LKGRYPKTKEATLVRGAARSRENAGTIATYHAPDLLWLIRVSVPFSYAASKNHIWTQRQRDPVARRADSRAFRANLTAVLKAAVGDRRIAQNKLWIDIKAQKPNHKGDAVNMVDLVCDAVKDATKLDDRWYSLRMVDWEIVKGEPLLFVGIGQESDDDLQVCSSCGIAQLLAEFAKNRSNRAGVARVCHGCRRVDTRTEIVPRGTGRK